MRRTITFPLIALGIFLFCWINLPKGISDQFRCWAASLFVYSPRNFNQKDVALLQIENQNLRAQIEHVYEWILFDQRIGEQFEFLKGHRDFSKKRTAHLRDLLHEQLSVLPAQVVYRDPSSWSSSLWVNVGEVNNQSLGRSVVSKNSPVLADGAVVGVVDYVGKKQARIRLITDSGLSPSVRVCRGATQNREIAREVQTLIRQLEKRVDLFTQESEMKTLLSELQRLKDRCGTDWEDGYLAKGEVHGSSAPFWRSRNPILKGVGFNFDYPDEDSVTPDAKVPILKEGDLLVTSGLDGVFPPGLPLGTVLSITSAKAGSHVYDIDVRPAANNLNDLQTVFILPSLSE